jgi:hypothetical protein
MKVTNTNEYSHSVGYQDPEKGKLNYTFEAGQTRDDIPTQHKELFTNIEGFTVDENEANTQKEEVNVEEKETTQKQEDQKQEEIVKEETKKKEEVQTEKTQEEKGKVKEDNGVNA